MGPLRPAVPSLRSAFVWSFAGNIVNGFSAWAVLALVARLTSIESLGQYALAVAVASPVAMLAHLNLRMVLATDVSGEHSDADYFQVRMWSAAAGLVITAAIGLAFRPFSAVGLTIILVGANFAVENIEDLYYAVIQRSERLDQVARSMVLGDCLGSHHRNVARDVPCACLCSRRHAALPNHYASFIRCAKSHRIRG